MYRIVSRTRLEAFETTFCIKAKQTVLIYTIVNRLYRLSIDLTLVVSTFSADYFSANRFVVKWMFFTD